MAKPKRRWFARIGILFLISMIGMFGISMTAKPPSNLGVNDGQLAPCPTSPNCVATQSGAETQKMEPIEIVTTVSPDSIVPMIAKVIEGQPRAKVFKSTNTYLHAEFTSSIFRFVDDVEFLVETSDETQRIHFRSASRVGHSDLGANRKRMERLVKEIQAKLDEQQ